PIRRGTSTREHTSRVFLCLRKECDMKPILRDLPVPIETPRLSLRPPMPGDGPAINAAVLDTFEMLKEWMPWAQERPTVETNEEWARRAHADWLLREDLPLTLWCRRSGQLAGGS